MTLLKSYLKYFNKCYIWKSASTAHWTNKTILFYFILLVDSQVEKRIRIKRFQVMRCDSPSASNSIWSRLLITVTFQVKKWIWTWTCNECIEFAIKLNKSNGARCKEKFQLYCRSILVSVTKKNHDIIATMISIIIFRKNYSENIIFVSRDAAVDQSRLINFIINKWQYRSIVISLLV